MRLRDPAEIRLDLAEIIGDGEDDVLEGLRRKARLRRGER